MDNYAKQTISSGPELENKQSEESRKIWDLQQKVKTVKINSDGSLPEQLNLSENILYPTDYVDSVTNKRKMIMVINKQTYFIEGSLV